MDAHQDKPLPRNCVKDFNYFRQQAYMHPEGGEELTSVYNEWASRYKQDTLSFGNLGPANLAGLASDIIDDKSLRILDAGSGVGMVGEELKKRGFTCIDALDPSQGSLDQAKTLQIYTEYICDTLDDHQTEIPDDCYDAVLMCGSFGVPGHVTDACFPELIRITKPGGYIMFTMSTTIMDQWDDDRVNNAITAQSKQGLWEVVDKRWIQYFIHESLNEKAIVHILRVLTKTLGKDQTC